MKREFTSNSCGRIISHRLSYQADIGITKGKTIRCWVVARHTETEEEFVVYRALYGEGGLWVRPKAMFLESVVTGDATTPRFVLIEPA